MGAAESGVLDVIEFLAQTFWPLSVKEQAGVKVKVRKPLRVNRNEVRIHVVFCLICSLPLVGAPLLPVSVAGYGFLTCKRMGISRCKKKRKKRRRRKDEL